MKINKKLDDESDCYDEDMNSETNFKNFDNQISGINAATAEYEYDEFLDDTDSQLSVPVENEPHDDYDPNFNSLIDQMKNI